MSTMETTMQIENHPTLLGGEIDDLLLRLRGLVLVRELLAARGASPAELDAHSREADRVRTRLAALIGTAE